MCFLQVLCWDLICVMWALKDIMVSSLFSCLFPLFRICYSDSIGVQEDQYPPNIAVKVNQSYCHVPVSFFFIIFSHSIYILNLQFEFLKFE